MPRKRSMFVNRSNRRNSAVGAAILIVILSLIVAFAGAYVWQKYSGDQEKLEQKQSLTSSPESSQPSSEPEKTSSADSKAESNQQEEESSASEESDSLPAINGAVPKGERVTTSYFDDAMFVGDSITNGILSYALMENAAVVSHVGINIDTIRYKEVFRKSDGSVVKIIDAMKDYPDVKKIYVMLGSNGIAWIDKENFIKYYKEFLTEVKAQHPDAIIYVQSMFPVTASKEKTDANFSKAKFLEYNALIASMAVEMGCYYLNVADALKDANGYLPEEASPSDGMHFGPQYYQKWFDYLKEHAIAVG